MSNDTAAPSETAPKKGAVGETVEIVKTVVYALLIALVIRTLLFQPYTIPSASEEPNLYQGDYIIVSKWSYGYSRHSILGSPPLSSGRIFFTPPKRGDVIVFKLPRDGHTDYIKRLIGLPGDRIQVRDDHLYINDRELEQLPQGNIVTQVQESADSPVFQIQVRKVKEVNPEGRSYDTQYGGGDAPSANTGVYVVPPHCYFMMGDNRDNSADSRFDPGLAPEDPKLGGCGWDGRLDAAVGNETGVGFVPEDNLVGKAQIVMLSWKIDSSLFKPWTWLNLRLDRFLRVIK
jgi:signal peptidase I